MNLHHVWACTVAYSHYVEQISWQNSASADFLCRPPPLTTAVSHNYAVFFCDSVNYHRDSSRCFLHSNCIVCFNYSCMHHSSWTLRPLLCILLFSPPKPHSVPSMLFIWGRAAVIKKGYLDPSTSSLSQEAGYSFPLCGQWTSCRIDKKRLAL